MSLKTVCNAIQDAVNASTRIRSAPHIEAWPPAIASADLPMSLTRPGPGSWPHDCIDDVRSHRTYVTEIFVKPNAQGMHHEGIEETLDIIQDVCQRLTGTSGGYTLSGAIHDSEPRDKGLVILEYGGAQYRGTVIELDVIEDTT